MKNDDRYPFRLESGEVIYVLFTKMIEQDAAGFIKWRGKSARRIHSPPEERPKKGASTGRDKPIVSDALGFTEHQLEGFQRDRDANGFTDVEFKPDPHVPQFYQVHVGSRAEWNRYVKHRGMFDKNSRNGGGASLTQADLDAAARRVKERYPVSGLPKVV